jgi:NAD-dependent SIR2 family protein deacetylase
MGMPFTRYFMADKNFNGKIVVLTGAGISAESGLNL